LDVLNPLTVGMPLAPLGTERERNADVGQLTNSGLSPACLLRVTCWRCEGFSSYRLQDQAATAAHLWSWFAWDSGWVLKSSARWLDQCKTAQLADLYQLRWFALTRIWPFPLHGTVGFWKSASNRF